MIILFCINTRSTSVAGEFIVIIIAADKVFGQSGFISFYVFLVYLLAVVKRGG